MQRRYDKQPKSKENLREKIIGLGEDSIHKNYFPQLQSRLRELEEAYDATLEGWALALELREHETNHHAQRVKLMTKALAEALGFSQEDIIHIQRGAMLHDIGKMGIPDSILLKPGPLDEEEWKIMKQHPLIAMQMLSKIEFLKPALVIPLYHHERWNGSGYPLGLEGEEIPLEARAFAIVDVCDALSWDRYYRKAWTPEVVEQYLEENAGVLFDPDIIKIFLELLRTEKFANLPNG